MNTGLLWRRVVLPNGLRVLLLPRQSANTTQLSVAVEYGSNNETEETAGSAHFLEHMLAGGSDKRIQLSRSIESLGGTVNFYTDHEYTMSLIDILPESLPKAAQALSQLLFDPTFEQEKFASERRIILNELAEVSDDPSEKIDELLLKSLFMNHPVKRPIGGYPKTITKLTLNRLSEIHQANYLPQKMILILTGKIADGDVEAVTQYFNGKAEQKGNPKKLHPLEVTKPKHEVIKRKNGISQSYLSIGAKTINTSSPDAPALDLIGMIMGSGASSRLFIELREKRALTYDVVSTHNKGLDFGYFNIECAVKEKNLAKAKELIFKEFAKLRNESVLEEELERNKRMILGGVLRGIDSLEECQDILAFMEIQFNSEKALAVYLDKIKAVSASEITRAANVYLQEDNFSTAILKPIK
jgi:predicted Zn-dependent peptidase